MEISDGDESSVADEPMSDPDSLRAAESISDPEPLADPENLPAAMMSDALPTEPQSLFISLFREMFLTLFKYTTVRPCFWFPRKWFLV